MEWLEERTLLSTAPAITTGLVSWWAGDGTANDGWDSKSGTLVNGTSFSAGRAGQTFNLDGVDDYVDFGNVLNIERTDSFTFSFWVSQQPSVSGFQFLVAKQDNFNTPGNLNGQGYFVGVNQSGQISFSLIHNQNGGTSDWLGIQGQHNIRDGAFHHIAVAYDGSSLAAGVHIYVDGAAENITVLSNTLSSSTVTTESFRFGAREGATFGLLQGKLDEITYYNRALTSAEVSTLANQFASAAGDFSATNNPTGPWQYGWSQSPGSAFNLDTTPTTRSVIDGHYADFWSGTPVFPATPEIARNTGEEFAANQSQVWPAPTRLTLHPSQDGKNGVVRWVASRAGVVNVSALFTRQDFNGGTDVHVLQNGVSLFSAINVGAIDTANSYTATRTVQAGDTIDFTVGSNGVYYSDLTGLEATVAYVPPTVIWDGGGDGVNWSDAKNWSNDTLPGPNDDVFVNKAGITVTHSSGSDIVHSLTASSGGFALTGGTLNAGTLSVSGAFDFWNGTLTNTTVASGTTITGRDTGTLDGVTLNGDLVLGTGGVNSSMKITNGLTLNGTARLGATNSYGLLRFDVSQTLGGSGVVVFGSADGRNSLWVRNLNTMLTIAAGITIRGQTGYVGYDPNLGGDSRVAVINQGTISADTTGGNIAVWADNGWTNNGTVESRNGGQLTAQNAPSNFTAGTLTGGTWKAFADSTLRVLLPSSVITNAANIALDGAGSNFYRDNGTTNALSAFATNTSGGSFTIQNGRNLTTTGAISNSGTLTVGTKSTFSLGGALSTNGLVSWWKAEGNASDSMGGNSGTLQNGTTFASGKVGQAFRFDGVDDSVDLGNWFNLQTFSLSLWVKPGSSQVQFADILDNNHTDARSWVIQYDNVPNRYHWGAATGGNQVIGFDLMPDSWQHLAITRGADNVTHVYVNGVLAGTAQGAGPINYDGTQFLRFGRWGGGGRNWNGQLDEIGLYNRALSASEIQAIASNTSFTQTNGSTVLNSGSLAVPDVVSLSGGVLSGVGTVAGNVINASQISPGSPIGTLTINGNYTQTAAGALNIDIGGLTADSQFDRLIVTGTAAFDGTLNVALVNNFTPALGDAVTPVTFASRNGDFATSNGLDSANLHPSFNPTNLTLICEIHTVIVTPTSGLVTTEAGGAANFSVALGAAPTANVAIGLSSSRPDEGTLSTSSLTFTPSNWNVPQTITVTGVDDLIDDGDINYTVITAPVVSADSTYSGFDAPDVFVTNLDDDNAGIIVAPTTGLVTSEAGATATFAVVLTSQPLAPVSIALSSSNSGEGSVFPTSLTFTQANWNIPQSVTLAGVDDPIVDGDIAYSITTLPAVSADAKYSGVNPPDVSVTNLDNDLLDLQVANLSISPAIGLQSGGTIVLRWDDQNTGNVATQRSFTDAVTIRNLTTGETLTTAQLLYDPAVAGNGPIQAGQVRSRQFSFALPNGDRGVGNIEVNVTVDANNDIAEGSISGNAEANNTAAITQQSALAPPPDLVVSDIVAPIEGLSGQAILVTWTVSNLGAADATGTWTDKVFLSSDQAAGGDQLFGSFPFTGTIPAGQSITRQQLISLPIDLSGRRWVMVQTDADNQLFEYTGESNNSTVDDRAIDIRLTPFPNLVVSSIAAPPTAFSSQQTVVEWTVSNTGNGATNALGWNDSVWLSPDNTLDELDTLLGTVPNASFLNAGDSYVNRLTVTLPRGISGNYYFLVKTDASNQVNELTGEGDNLRAGGPTNVQLTPPPDLQVTQVGAPGEAFSGQQLTLNWTVANQGPGRTLESSWHDNVFMSSDPVLDGGDTFLGQASHAGTLDSGQSYQVTQAVTLPVGISGDFFFIVKTDAGNEVFEHAFEGNNEGKTAAATTIHLTPPPDLEATSVSAPADALAGHALTITYSVTNAGSTATPNTSWTDSFYLSTDNQFDPATDLLLGDRTRFGSLDAGASYDASATFTLPNGLAGSFYVFAVVDRGNSVFELDKTNNVYFDPAPVAISSRPADLVISAASSPASAEAGKAIRVAWTVANQGHGDTATSSWTDEIVASSDAVLGGDDDVRLASFDHTGLLNPGQSYARSELLQIPLSIAGPRYWFAVTDWRNQVFEGSSEGNNASTPLPVVVIQQKPDLQATEIIGPSSALSGDSITLQWTVQNFGAGPTNVNFWYDNVYLSTDATISDDDRLLAQNRRANPLGAGEHYDASTTFNLPLDIGGTFFLIVRTDATNVVDEDPLDDNNDQAFGGNAGGGITVTHNPAADQAPDLVVASVAAPESAVSGQSFTATWTVRNDGDGTADGNWFDAVYLSLDQFFDPTADIYLGFRDHGGGLAPDDSYTSSQSFDIPRGLSGPFYVFITTDGGNRVDERGSELNNIGYGLRAMQVVLPQPADLVVTGIQIPVAGIAGQNVTITYTVLNQGTSAAVGTWSNLLYLSADDQWDIGDAFLGRINHNGDVPSGSSYSQSLTAAIPGLLPGDYHVIVRTDIRNNVPESDESNNTGSSAGLIAVDAHLLDLGTAADGSFASASDVFYRVNVDAGQTLLISLDATTTTDSKELYVRAGNMPSRSKFDLASAEPFNPNRQVIVPLTAAGTYYVMVHAATGATASSTFHILARTLGFEILSADSGPFSNTGAVTIAVRGSQLQQDTTFNLITPEGPLPATRIFWQNGSLNYVTFDFNGVRPGSYGLAASRRGSTVQLQNAITIYDGAPGLVSAMFNGPSSVRPSRTNRMVLNYGNSGRSDVVSPLFVISTPTATPFRQPGGVFSASAITIFASSLDGPINLLRPGASVSYSFDFNSVTSPIEYDLDEILVSDSRPLDFPDFVSPWRPASLTDAEWQNALATLEALVRGNSSGSGLTYGDLVRAIGETAQSLASSGHRTTNVQELLAAMIATAIQNNGGVITGQVLNDADGNILAGVTVTVNGTSTADEYATTTTSPDGTFTLSGIAPGSYQISVPGYFVTGNNTITTPRMGATAQTLFATAYSVAAASLNVVNQTIPPPPVVPYFTSDIAWTAAKAAYGDTSLPAEWSIAQTFPNDAQHFFAEAWEDSFGDLIIAFRGTRASASNWTDIYTDISFGWSSWESSGACVVSYVRSFMAANPYAHVLIAGHSLGGGLAEYLTYALSVSSGHPIVPHSQLELRTFNGIGGAYQIATHGGYDDINLYGVDIRHLRALGDLVSVAGAHIGYGSSALPFNVNSSEPEQWFGAAHFFTNQFGLYAVSLPDADSTPFRLSQQDMLGLDQAADTLRAFASAGQFGPPDRTEVALRVGAAVLSLDNVDPNAVRRLREFIAQNARDTGHPFVATVISALDWQALVSSLKHFAPLGNIGLIIGACLVDVERYSTNAVLPVLSRIGRELLSLESEISKQVKDFKHEIYDLFTLSLSALPQAISSLESTINSTFAAFENTVTTIALDIEHAITDSGPEAAALLHNLESATKGSLLGTLGSELSLLQQLLCFIKSLFGLPCNNNSNSSPTSQPPSSPPSLPPSLPPPTNPSVPPNPNPPLPPSAPNVSQPAITLRVGTTILAEGTSTHGYLWRVNSDVSRALSVSLQSSDGTRLTVPGQVIFPVGSSFISFVMRAVNDGIHEGPEPVTITASASGLIDSTELTVTDDQPVLSLDIGPSTISEGAVGIASNGIVTRNFADTSQPLLVQLLKIDVVGRISIPGVVRIEKDKSSATFAIYAVDNSTVDGNGFVTVIARASGFVNAGSGILVIDNDSAYRPAVVTGRDPNDILGPDGFGSGRWVKRDTPLSYTIRFENQSEASAPAQRVTVRQALESGLDPRSFRVGDFGFGDLIIDVPPNRAFYSTRLDLTATKGVYVDVTAGIDVTTAEAFWTFTTIDLATGEPTANALAGFLPPDDANGSGEGFVTYSVLPKATTRTGDVIHASARIVFDTEQPIDTPTIFNTIDAAGPISQVAALPPRIESDDRTFLVQWSGQDDDSGSALSDFTVYVSQNGGPFTAWLQNTTLTAATYLGEPGNRYAFYSRARDNAGNIEPAPAVADAMTLIPLPIAIDAGADQGVVEGDAIELTQAGYTFSGDASTLSLTIDWGDGTTEGGELVPDSIGGTIATTHRYADDGIFTVLLTLHDDRGNSAQDSLVVTVANALPTIPTQPAQETDEGATFVLAVAFADAGIGDTHSAMIDWGDGTPLEQGVVSDSGGRGIVDGNHLYRNNGQFLFTMNVRDDDAGLASTSFYVTVKNLPPAVAASTATVSVQEGATAANGGTWSDLGLQDIVTLSASIGAVVKNADGTWSWSWPTSDGPADSQTVTISATDIDGASSSTTFSLVVLNVPPNVAIIQASVTVNEGETASNTGTWSDPGLDVVAVTASIGTVVTHADGTWSWSWPTSDGPDDTQIVTITATDSDGATRSATFDMLVKNLPPIEVAANAAVIADEGQTATNTGTWSDPGLDAVTLAASIGNVIKNSSGTWTWSWPTTDGPDESQTVTIMAVDSDGATSSTTFSLVVNNLSPTAHDARFEVEENSASGTFVGIVMAIDPGADRLGYSITGGTGAAAFAIDGTTGKITVANSALIDYEATHSFTLQVSVTDGDGVGVSNVTIDVLNLPSISGAVFVDTNGNGLFDADEMGLDGVVVELLDSTGQTVLNEAGLPIHATTLHGGLYLFEDLKPGLYSLHEIQPSGVLDGPEFLGSLGGAVVANDTIQLGMGRTDAFDYYFTELGQTVTGGESAGIGFWQNKNGQDLIKQGGTKLAAWLSANFGNVFGNLFVGASGAEVATFYKDQLFKSQAKKSAEPAKVDAQFMAVALAAYFTNRTLAGNVAAGYGFNVTDEGLGAKLVNVGSNGAAFSVANNTNLTVLQLLLATNRLTDTPDRLRGFASIYDKNGDGIIDSAEAALRTQANDIYSWINDQGGI